MSIRVEEITKIYGQQKALDRVSFEIKKGEIVGFLGPNGAGKSTMMKIITGFIKADEGIVRVNDLDVNIRALEVQKIIGYLPENNPLYPELYVKEFLEFAAKISGLRQNIPQRIAEVIEMVGLTPEAHKKIGQLSKGYRQRVGLAQALIHNPEILILDEPTTGLDPNQIIEIRDLISRLGKEKTVMLSTHIMQEVEAICTRVIIIKKGKIVANQSTQAIQHDEQKQIISVELNKEVEVDFWKSLKSLTNLRRIDEKQWLLEFSTQEDMREQIFKLVVEKGLSVLSMQKKDKSLEEVFRQLTQK